jgi:hypothetical protein
MPTYTDIPVPGRILFRAENFCFYTTTPARSPTLYFALGGLAQLNTAASCGRLRTRHGSGPLIDIKTHAKGHAFFQNQNDFRTVGGVIRGLYRRGMAEYARVVADLAQRAHTDVPFNQAFHFEFTKDSATTMLFPHASGGTVELAPRPTTDQILKMLHAMLAENATIKNGNTVVYQWPGGPQNAVAGIAPYLASL